MADKVRTTLITAVVVVWTLVLAGATTLVLLLVLGDDDDDQVRTSETRERTEPTPTPSPEPTPTDEPVPSEGPTEDFEEDEEEASAFDEELLGSGSSTLDLVLYDWVLEFEEAEGGVVTYSPIGSLNGAEEFLSGDVHFVGLDEPLSEEDIEESQEICGPDGAFHLPTAARPLAVVTNLPGIETVNLSPETLAQIFSGEITTWDDDSIAEHNPDADLPDTPITVVHREELAGDTETMTSYLAAAAPDTWEWDPDAEWPEDIAAETAQGTFGVLEAVEEAEGAISYVDWAVVDPDFTVVALGLEENYVEPSEEAVGLYLSDVPIQSVDGAAEHDLVLNHDYVQLYDDYPLVRITYTAWCTEYPTEEEAELAAAFAEYIHSEEAQELVADFGGTVPIPEELREQAADSLSMISAAD
ncbi:phosphate ABC transporter substrate-binding protein PstS [Nesterenkonia flava]|uniref:Phosphate-binding protein n=1 Tax=Nesterenkonia flava TaxID=469799 RepID=A0ABU1FVL1_9MICC|nr:phosphate ABC transporter substrate-binding protein PstS [Nesterenkonia flava]MDR5712218.1 phosphate ABC transporter substrate-binding protein PstS [Nesterenkonia flava]